MRLLKETLRAHLSNKSLPGVYLLGVFLFVVTLSLWGVSFFLLTNQEGSVSIFVSLWLCSLILVDPANWCLAIGLNYVAFFEHKKTEKVKPAAWILYNGVYITIVLGLLSGSFVIHPLHGPQNIPVESIALLFVVFSIGIFCTFLFRFYKEQYTAQQVRRFLKIRSQSKCCS